MLLIISFTSQFQFLEQDKIFRMKVPLTHIRYFQQSLSYVKWLNYELVRWNLIRKEVLLDAHTVYCKTWCAYMWIGTQNRFSYIRFYFKNEIPHLELLIYYFDFRVHLLPYGTTQRLLEQSRRNIPEPIVADNLGQSPEEINRNDDTHTLENLILFYTE